MKDISINKKPYVAPELEVFEFAVECEQNLSPFKTTVEQVTEFTDNEGENEKGVWETAW
ncbi:MAG: hypothetical protein Q4D03_07585 [Bacteroidales bacterium]|nr:hypothetical protein [Bacteroidales bacterium]